jgi:uroporphyrinogen decarboxylase
MSNATLTKRERMSRVVAGLPVDRLPISLWRHFYVEETAAEPLVRRLAEWHRRFDFDFVKINVRAQYHSEAWGATHRYFGQQHRKPELVTPGVRAPGDFAGLGHLDPWAEPLGEMIDVVRGLRSELGSDALLLMTVFNPLSVAHDLVGDMASLRAAIEADPVSVHRGLRAITDTFRDFTMVLMDEGCEGLFFATTEVATAEVFTLEEYEEFGRPYDLEVLEAADTATLNMLHVCKSSAFVRPLADYPVHAISWDSGDPANASLADMRGPAGEKALVGGLSRELFAEAGAAERLVGELDAAWRQMGDRPFVVGSTCTIPTRSLDENIDAVRAAIERVGEHNE